MNIRSLGDQARGLSRQLPLTLSQERGTAMDNMLIQRRFKGLATAAASTIVAESAVGALEFPE